MNDEWFADEEAVRKSLGLLLRPSAEPVSDARDVSNNLCIIFGMFFILANCPHLKNICSSPVESVLSLILLIA